MGGIHTYTSLIRYPVGAVIPHSYFLHSVMIRAVAIGNIGTNAKTKASHHTHDSETKTIEVQKVYKSCARIRSAKGDH